MSVRSTGGACGAPLPGSSFPIAAGLILALLAPAGGVAAQGMGEDAGRSMADGGDPWAAVPAEAWTEDGRLDLRRVDEDHRFDFLLGDFTYAFQGGDGAAAYESAIDGSGIRGTIHGSVSGARFGGASLTFRSAEDGTWQRRWIDTLGNVLIGIVEMDEGYDASDLPALVSHIQEPLNGVLFRHVWYDITRDSFGTDLLASQDGGETWVVARRMPYVRVH